RCTGMGSCGGKARRSIRCSTPPGQGRFPRCVAPRAPAAAEPGRYRAEVTPVGLHPDHRRRAQAARLRAERLTFEAVGRQLGVSKQRAFTLVRAHRTGKEGLWEPVRCREWRAALNAKVAMKRDDLRALCIACSKGKPLAKRLKARRIAAGLF